MLLCMFKRTENAWAKIAGIGVFVYLLQGLALVYGKIQKKRLKAINYDALWTLFGYHK